jgi:hypothetical protein
MAILMQQITAEPPPLSTHLPDVPSTIDDVVQWLLAKDPSERPADLRTAVHALEQAALDGGLDIGPVPAWDVQSTQGKAYQTQPPRRTNVVATPVAPTMAPAPKKSRAPLVGGIVAALAVLAGIGVFALGGKQEKKPAPHVEPPPVATPVAPAPTPPPPPPVPTSSIITVAGVPEGTEVLVGDKVVGIAPGPVQLDRGVSPVVLMFRAEGYLPASKSIVPDGDKPLDVTLKKKAVRGGGKKPGRDDIIDVFGGKK